MVYQNKYSAEADAFGTDPPTAPTKKEAKDGCWAA